MHAHTHQASVSLSSLLTIVSQQNHVHWLGPRLINRLHSKNKKGITNRTAACWVVYGKATILGKEA